jgi:hypothetical protein
MLKLHVEMLMLTKFMMALMLLPRSRGSDKCASDTGSVAVVVTAAEDDSLVVDVVLLG